MNNLVTHQKEYNMAPAIAAAIIAAIGGAGTSMGRGISKASRARKAQEIIQNLDIPPAEKFMYEAYLRDDPEKFFAEAQRDTELAQISEDPRLKQAQMGALQQLQDIGAGGGYTAAERGDIESISRDMLTRQRGAEEAGLQRAQGRGLGGSGLNLASDIARRQAGVGAASRAGFDIAKGGALRTLQAGQMAGGLGGQIRGQEWGQQAQTAGAQDAINRANALARNQAGMFNIQQQQSTAAANQAAINAQRKADADAQLARTKLDLQKQRDIAGTYTA